MHGFWRGGTPIPLTRLGGSSGTAGRAPARRRRQPRRPRARHQRDAKRGGCNPDTGGPCRPFAERRDGDQGSKRRYQGGKSSCCRCAKPRHGSAVEEDGDDPRQQALHDRLHHDHCAKPGADRAHKAGTPSGASSRVDQIDTKAVAAIAVRPQRLKASVYSAHIPAAVSSSACAGQLAVPVSISWPPIAATPAAMRTMPSDCRRLCRSPSSQDRSAAMSGMVPGNKVRSPLPGRLAWRWTRG